MYPRIKRLSQLRRWYHPSTSTGTRIHTTTSTSTREVMGVPSIRHFCSIPSGPIISERLTKLMRAVSLDSRVHELLKNELYIINKEKHYDTTSIFKLVFNLYASRDITLHLASDICHILGDDLFSEFLNAFLLINELPPAMELFHYAVDKKIPISYHVTEELVCLCSREGDIEAMRQVIDEMWSPTNGLLENVLFPCIMPLIASGHAYYLSHYVAELVQKTSVEENLSKIIVAILIGMKRRAMGEPFSATEQQGLYRINDAIISRIKDDPSLNRERLRAECFEFLVHVRTLGSIRAFPFLGNAPASGHPIDVDCSHVDSEGVTHEPVISFYADVFPEMFSSFRRIIESSVYTELSIYLAHVFNGSRPKVMAPDELRTPSYSKAFQEDQGYVAYSMVYNKFEDMKYRGDDGYTEDFYDDDIDDDTDDDDDDTDEDDEFEGDDLDDDEDEFDIDFDDGFEFNDSEDVDIEAAYQGGRNIRITLPMRSTEGKELFQSMHILGRSRLSAFDYGDVTEQLLKRDEGPIKLSYDMSWTEGDNISFSAVSAESYGGFDMVGGGDGGGGGGHHHVVIEIVGDHDDSDTEK